MPTTPNSACGILYFKPPSRCSLGREAWPRNAASRTGDRLSTRRTNRWRSAQWAVIPGRSKLDAACRPNFPPPSQPTDSFLGGTAYLARLTATRPVSPRMPVSTPKPLGGAPVACLAEAPHLLALGGLSLRREKSGARLTTVGHAPGGEGGRLSSQARVSGAG